MSTVPTPYNSSASMSCRQTFEFQKITNFLILIPLTVPRCHEKLLGFFLNIFVDTLFFICEFVTYTENLQSFDTLHIVVFTIHIHSLCNSYFIITEKLKSIKKILCDCLLINLNIVFTTFCFDILMESPF